jgi:hypothetical protein
LLVRMVELDVPGFRSGRLVQQREAGRQCALHDAGIGAPAARSLAATRARRSCRSRPGVAKHLVAADHVFLLFGIELAIVGVKLAPKLVDLLLPSLLVGAEVGLELAPLAAFARSDNRDVGELVAVAPDR